MPQHAVLLADANRQVQIADHLLTTTYAAVKDPKILISVMEHARRAIEDAAEAVVDLHVSSGAYELPRAVMRVGGKHDALMAFGDLMKVRQLTIAADADAIKLCHDLRVTLQQHKEAPTTFQRDEKLVIAGEGFEYLKEITPSEIKKGMHIVKQFVHACHSHVALAKEEKR